MKMMIKTLFFLLTFQSVGISQDTLYVVPQDTSGFLVGIGSRNLRHGQMDVQYNDNVYTKDDLINYLLELIRRNEESLVGVEVQLAKANERKKLYEDTDSLLVELTGKGFLSWSFQKFGKSLAGFYEVKIRGISLAIQLQPDGKVIQVQPDGKPTPGGMSGAWEVWDQRRIRINGFFPETLVPPGSYFNLNDEGEYVSASSIIKLKKIN